MQDNVKLLKRLESGCKQTINWNKYQSTPEILGQNWCLSYLIDPSFEEGVNRLFVLSFENEINRTTQTGYYLPEVVGGRQHNLWSEIF